MKLTSTFLLPLLGGLLLSLAAVSLARAATPPKIGIRGVDGEILTNISKALSFPDGLISDGTINQLWLNRYIRLAPAKVARALEPFGYYAAKVDIRVDRLATPLAIQITIDPGLPVRIATRRLEIVGFQHKELRQALDRFPLAPGSIVQHLPYEKAKAELQAIAVGLGYLDATYSSHQIRIDRGNNTAHLELVLDTGPRYRFGPIRIHGGEDYPEKFLRRYLVARQGEFFSYPELGKTQQQFLDSDRFGSVLIAPQRQESENHQVPVEIRLETKAPKRLRPGVGYGTDTGARFFLRYQEVNAWHLGHEFTTDLLLAERKQNLIANYLFPGYRNLDSMFALRGGYQAEDLDTYETHYVFAEAEQLYGFSEGRVGSMFVRFQHESSTISGEEITTGMVVPGVRLRMGKLVDPVRPQKGYRLSLEVRGAWDVMFSEISLFQALGDINVIYPFPWQTYLRLRGSAGTSVQKNDFADIPASLRFFAGGDNSVRGYAFRSLGPTNAQGEVIGGKNLLVGSIELEKRFLQDWGAAAFYDAGNAFNSPTDYTLAEAVGIGLRYFTPVGPARIDLARTIRADKANYRIHLGLGVGW
ncbi:MAG: hypothetical protein A2005_04010 [Desulfuromonadales bacterium GWC2_61_20]|nr:MAG: hypothetical protein A2005_04010 [Desulfuromonadales bacterium GWC2_61_20]HAD05335.1 outer membrane protein assembly factor [Desulfuromonas sp.]